MKGGGHVIPGLLRRVSWQRVATFIAPESDLEWLVTALRDKYAITPD